MRRWTVLLFLSLSPELCLGKRYYRRNLEEDKSELGLQNYNYEGHQPNTRGQGTKIKQSDVYAINNYNDNQDWNQNKLLQNTAFVVASDPYKGQNAVSVLPAYYGLTKTPIGTEYYLKRQPEQFYGQEFERWKKKGSSSSSDGVNYSAVNLLGLLALMGMIQHVMADLEATSKSHHSSSSSDDFEGMSISRPPNRPNRPPRPRPVNQGRPVSTVTMRPNPNNPANANPANSQMQIRPQNTQGMNRKKKAKVQFLEQSQSHEENGTFS